MTTMNVGSSPQAASDLSTCQLLGGEAEQPPERPAAPLAREETLPILSGEGPLASWEDSPGCSPLTQFLSLPDFFLNKPVPLCFLAKVV